MMIMESESGQKWAQTLGEAVVGAGTQSPCKHLLRDVAETAQSSKSGGQVKASNQESPREQDRSEQEIRAH